MMYFTIVITICPVDFCVAAAPRPEHWGAIWLQWAWPASSRSRATQTAQTQRDVPAISSLNRLVFWKLRSNQRLTATRFCFSKHVYIMFLLYLFVLSSFYLHLWVAQCFLAANYSCVVILNLHVVKFYQKIVKYSIHDICNKILQMLTPTFAKYLVCFLT